LHKPILEAAEEHQPSADVLYNSKKPDQI